MTFEKKPENQSGGFVGLSWLASSLKVHRATIRRWIKEGRFPQPSIKIGRSMRWSLSALAGAIPGFSDGSQAGEGVASCK